MGNRTELTGLLEALSVISKQIAETLPDNQQSLPLIYVASPLRGDIEENLKNANRFCRFVVANQAIPIAPHVFFKGFLDDRVPEEREIGMFLGKELLKQCCEVWVFSNNGRLSEGMKAEIELAEGMKIPVRYFGKDEIKCSKTMD